MIKTGPMRTERRNAEDLYDDDAQDATQDMQGAYQGKACSAK
jgi:hypothetical protein